MEHDMSRLAIRELPTDQFEERPAGVAIDTLVVHSMHNPEADDKFSAQSCKECLDKFEVSAHYIVDLAGVIWRTVQEDKKAWHAGPSRMPDPADGREKVNDFSIGIELVGTEDTDFTEAQYRSLCSLIKDISSRHAIKNVVGHSDIAPERKTDPWGLDWQRVRAESDRLCGEGQLKFCKAAY